MAETNGVRLEFQVFKIQNNYVLKVRT